MIDENEQESPTKEYATGNVQKIDKLPPGFNSLTATPSGNGKVKIFAESDDDGEIAKYVFQVGDPWGGQFGIAKEVNTTSKTCTYFASTDIINTFKVTVYDKAGNSKTSEVFRCSDYIEPPTLATDMTAIYWENGIEKELTSTSSDQDWDKWYHYVAGNNQTDTKTSQWANAKTKDGSYWVWIPRYEYKITGGGLTGPASQTPGKIEVKFVHTGMTTASQGFKIHPAFRNGTSTNYRNGEWNAEIPGIWVAKFETSMGDTAGTATTAFSLPEKTSARNITVGTAYDISYSWNRNLESHLMKNSEWGAVAYLAHSQYGRNGARVGKNTSSGYQTGSGGVNNASTTGNIYGILDLSGGAAEYVAAYISNGKTSKGSSFALQKANQYGWQTKSTKYATVYPYDSVEDQTTANPIDTRRQCNFDSDNQLEWGYGDTIREISKTASGLNAWFSNTSCYPYTDFPFFVRGGSYDDVGAGIFAYSSSPAWGGADDKTGFRMVLIP